MLGTPREEWGWPEIFFEEVSSGPEEKKSSAMNRVLAEGGLGEFLHLEFKRSPPDVNEPDADAKRNFSRSVSAFANAEGGLIIWGVDWPDGRAKQARNYREGKRPLANGIEKADVYCNWLQNARKEAVCPPAPELQSLIVPNPGNADRPLVVTYVAKSYMAPHMAHMEGEHRYYRRGSDMTRMMDAYEIEDLLGRRSGPVLIPRAVYVWEKPQEPNSEKLPRIRVVWDFWNHGRGMATHVCFELRSRLYGPEKPIPIKGVTGHFVEKVQNHEQKYKHTEVLGCQPLAEGYHAFDCYIPIDGPPIPPTSHKAIAEVIYDLDVIRLYFDNQLGDRAASALRVEMEWKAFAEGMRPRTGILDLHLPGVGWIDSVVCGPPKEIECKPCEKVSVDAFKGITIQVPETPDAE